MVSPDDEPAELKSVFDQLRRTRVAADHAQVVAPAGMVHQPVVQAHCRQRQKDADADPGTAERRQARTARA